MYQFHYEIKHHFDAAHRLPNYPGKCSKVHGHRWEVMVEITVVAPRLPGSGMFIDFLKVKEAVNELDHCNLNDLFVNPTAERIATWLIAGLEPLIGDTSSHGLRVTVQESPGNKISVERWHDLYEVAGSSWREQEGSGTFHEGDVLEVRT